MNNPKTDSQKIYKWISIICLALIPLAAGIGIIFNINRDPIQILIMSLGFMCLSWTSWSTYKRKI